MNLSRLGTVGPATDVTEQSEQVLMSKERLRLIAQSPNITDPRPRCTPEEPEARTHTPPSRSCVPHPASC